jgi:hypothetical protein
MNITEPLGPDEIEKSSEVEVRRDIRELAPGQALARLALRFRISLSLGAARRAR